MSPAAPACWRASFAGAPAPGQGRRSRPQRGHAGGGAAVGPGDRLARGDGGEAAVCGRLLRRRGQPVRADVLRGSPRRAGGDVAGGAARRPAGRRRLGRRRTFARLCADDRARRAAVRREGRGRAQGAVRPRRSRACSRPSSLPPGSRGRGSRRGGDGAFPSIDDWMLTDVKGWTLADLVDDAGFARLQEAAQRELGGFTTAEGSVSFAMPAHLAVAASRRRDQSASAGTSTASTSSSTVPPGAELDRAAGGGAGQRAGDRGGPGDAPGRGVGLVLAGEGHGMGDAVLGAVGDAAAELHRGVGRVGGGQPRGGVAQRPVAEVALQPRRLLRGRFGGEPGLDQRDTPLDSAAGPAPSRGSARSSPAARAAPRAASRRPP